VIYLDSSALVKLVYAEPESGALRQWLAERQDIPKVTSQLSTIEVVRACRRRDEDDVVDARIVLTGLDILPLTADVVEQAALVGPAELRSLDAIHLATALALRDDISTLVAYDERLGGAAAAAGLDVAAPR
jgi:uncharacterized protein